MLYILTFGVLLLGLAVGSFLNVVIYRMPKGESIVWPGSHCPKCGEPLKWYHNIPLFSWIFLGGKCAFCKEPISKRYPMVELLNGLIWVALFWSISSNSEALDIWNMLYFLFIAMTFSSLLALTMIDFDYFAVPDALNFFALGSAILASVAKAIGKGDWSIALDAIINALIASGGLWFLAWSIGKVVGRDAMGEADVIVAGTMAALLGLWGFGVALFISALLAIIPSLFARDTMVPFVPFLSTGTLITFLFLEPILRAIKQYLYG